MKIKVLAATLVLAAGSLNVAAQQDSLCNVNSSVSHEAVRAKSFETAYLPWKQVMKDCPTLRYYTYTDGISIMEFFLSKNKKGTAEYDKYVTELMGIYDQLMEYTPAFREKGVRVRAAEKTLGLKAISYIRYASKVDVNQAYQWFSQSVEKAQGSSSSAVLFYFLQTSLNKLRADNTHAEQFIQDYITSSTFIDEAISKAKTPGRKKSYAGIKENLVALFINSGAADCASLEKVYAPKVEENKDNLDYLKKVTSIMKMVKGGRDSETYQKASFYSYKLEPTADAAVGCGLLAYKKNDFTGAVKFFDEAIQLEQDDATKADIAYKAAAVLSAGKKYSKSKVYCLKAVKFNKNFGAPYILLAKLYASSPKWSKEPVLNSCTYFAVVDKLYRAKSVDPSVAEEAQKLINTYSQYFPTTEKLFFLGLKKGDTVQIGGWINESTTIR